MRVSVTSLCEFAARKGDLDFRYTPAPTAREGIAGHNRLQRRRGLNYQAEYMLEGQCEGLKLGGRADGYDANAGMIEEIKTHRGDVSRVPEAQQALHRAQLHAYGALLCASENRDSISLCLTYYDIDRDLESRQERQLDANELWLELVDLCRAYLLWNQREQAHRQQRDTSLSSLKFPFGQFRGGQRELAESVFKSFCLGKSLLLQAPTGIGKTVGTLFPALMAMAREEIDRVFYLTARNTVRQLALEGVQRVLDYQAEPVSLRVLEFSARTQSCEYPELACHGASCPLARGFFDRLAGAREVAAGHQGVLDQPRLRKIAQEFEICPYYLAQEMTRWCDLVISDVNRFFDQGAILHALVAQNNWKAGLLIDEGHNLIDRARGMYSAALSQSALLAVKRHAPDSLRRPLQHLARQWTSLIAGYGLNQEGQNKNGTPLQLETVPAELCGSAHAAIASITDYLSEHRADAALQDLLFDLLGFLGLAGSFGEHSLCELSRPRRGRARLAIQNLVPADFLAPRFKTAHSSVLFSATLAPAAYHRDLLGLNQETHWQDIASPFSADQLELRLVTRVSTRLPHRQASIQPITQLIGDQYQHHPANYLVYFSSFAYLQAAIEPFEESLPDIPVWRQTPGMSADERSDFIDRFQETGQGVGFAVLGGAFAEGIDLPGKRLYGVFIATLGLPPFDAWHEILRKRLQARYGRGYDYAYLYPGLQKVAQAAGRVIRTPDDRGVVILIDDRFGRPEVRALLPDWWPAPVYA